MELLEILKRVRNIDKNRIFVPALGVTAENTRVSFEGDGEGAPNILFIEPGVYLLNCDITFYGNNSVVFLRKSHHKHRVNISIFSHSVIYIGEDNYFNPHGNVYMMASEEQNILIGDNGLFSWGVWMRTSDAHGVYDCIQGKRLNNGRSVLVGNHVWLGQESLVLKGAQIGSGCIVGARSVVTGHRFAPNSSLAGNPAKTIREGVFFAKRCLHRYGEEEVYSHSEEKVLFSREDDDKLWNVNHTMRQVKDAGERLEILQRDMLDAL